MNRHRKAELQTGISEYGMMVLETCCSHHGPTTMHTLGLLEKYGFELIMIGCPRMSAYQFMMIILNEYLLKGETIEAGTIDTDLATFPMKFMLCDPAKSNKHMSEAIEFYGRKDFTVLQLVMTDPSGKFPEDSGFNHKLMDRAQELLY